MKCRLFSCFFITFSASFVCDVPTLLAQMPETVVVEVAEDEMAEDEAAEDEILEDPVAPSVPLTPMLTLPEICPTAAQFVETPWGQLLITCPNVTDKNHPPVLMRVTPENKAYLWSVSPIDPVTGTASPTVAQFGPDGGLYLCDNQSSDPTKASGRILRVLVNENNRPYGAEVVAYGMKNPRGLAVLGNNIYVLNCTSTDAGTHSATCLLHRFPLDGTIIEVKNTPSDPTVLAVFASTEQHDSPHYDFLVPGTENTLWLGVSGMGAVYSLVVPEIEEGKKPETPLMPQQAAELKCAAVSAMAIGADEALYVLDAAERELKIMAKSGDVRTISVAFPPETEISGQDFAAVHFAMTVRGGEVLILISAPKALPRIFRLPVTD